MKLTKYLSPALVLGSLLALTGNSFGQAFNVDLNDNAGGGVAPPATYGAFTGQTGFWNPWAPTNSGTNSFIAKDATGGVSAVRFVTVNSGAVSMGTQPGIIVPDDVDLMSDYLPHQSSVREFEVLNLVPGEYRVVVYTWRPGGLLLLQCSTPTGGLVSSGGISNGQSYPGLIPQQSLGVCTVTVGAQETLTIRLLCDVSHSDCATNGIQLLPLVGSTSCPQGPNSTGGLVELSGWASSTVANTVSIAANDLVVAAGITQAPLVSPNTAVIIWASDTLATNPFASQCPLIGTRCIGSDTGSQLFRASVGMQTNFGTYSGAIDMNMLAMGPNGLNVSPGNPLYFQMLYRDADVPIVCGTPSVVRWTEVLEVTLAP